MLTLLMTAHTVSMSVLMMGKKPAEQPVYDRTPYTQVEHMLLKRYDKQLVTFLWSDRILHEMYLKEERVSFGLCSRKDTDYHGREGIQAGAGTGARTGTGSNICLHTVSGVGKRTGSGGWISKQTSKPIPMMYTSYRNALSPKDFITIPNSTINDGLCAQTQASGGPYSFKSKQHD